MPSKSRKSKKNLKSTTSINTDTPEIILRKLDNKEKDIRAILLMIENIDSIISSSSIDLLTKNYTTIANLANQMTRFGPTCIRNKYALCWKDIYHIQIVIENEPVHLADIIQKNIIRSSCFKKQIIIYTQR
ncbi:MAG: hypothetical protein JKY53_13115 [Flavobacteriales bacterium]|nr:hypothetical protein [Flavobacteriales bacterium]